MYNNKKKTLLHQKKRFIQSMVPRNGFEPSTVRVWTVCSSQLSYLGIGGDKRDRTADLRSASATLSQLSHIPLWNGAGNEGRTRDIQLGRLTLYQLSYSRIAHHRKYITIILKLCQLFLWKIDFIFIYLYNMSRVIYKKPNNIKRWKKWKRKL